MDVHEHESRNLHQRDDERPFSNGSQVVSDQSQNRRQDGGDREPVLVPETDVTVGAGSEGGADEEDECELA